MFSTTPMDRLGYLAYTNDADVDSLLSQLSDENLLKLKVNTHNTSSRGFEYPTFTDGWMEGDDPTEALDTQLTSRFSTLKRPIAPPKKKGADLPKGSKKAFNLDGGLGPKKENGDSPSFRSKKSADSPTFGSKKSRDSPALVGKKSGDSPPEVGKKSRDSLSLDRKARDSDVIGWKGGEESGRLSGKSSSRTLSRRGEDGSSARRGEDGSSARRHSISREVSRGSSWRTEFRSFKFSDDPAAAAASGDDEGEDDPDNLDALLNERFRALKAPSPPLFPPTSSAPSTGNLGLDNIIRISGQLSSNDYDSYGSTFSSLSSPSANLLGRSKRRSSPRLMTTSVATSCHCSAPSALKLLKQVGSKSFPSKQQLSPGSLPPLSPAPHSSPPVKKAAREFKVEGFGNSKPTAKENEKKSVKETRGKNERKSGNEEANPNNPTTVKDMRRLFSSVADRVGLERSRVSSAADDEFLDEDLSVWSAMEGEEEFASASTTEEKLNREAERVVEWAKDAARLGAGESDIDSDADNLELNEVDDDGDSDRKQPKKEKPNKKKGFNVAPKKKKWGIF